MLQARHGHPPRELAAIAMLEAAWQTGFTFLRTVLFLVARMSGKAP